MSATNGGESLRNQYEQYGPYGDWGDHVGQCSIIALAGLSKPIPGDVREDTLVVLGSNDFQIFEALDDIEGGIRFIQPQPDVGHQDVQALHRAFRRFHTALPLSEAERYWLFDPLTDAISRHPEGMDPYMPATFFGVAEEVTSGGIKQVIQGGEVVRRMAEWRREANEFAGQGTLNEARAALGEIASTLVIDANWPGEHENLRVQLRESAQS